MDFVLRTWLCLSLQPGRKDEEKNKSDRVGHGRAIPLKQVHRLILMVIIDGCHRVSCIKKPRTVLIGIGKRSMLSYSTMVVLSIIPHSMSVSFVLLIDHRCSIDLFCRIMKMIRMAKKSFYNGRRSKFQVPINHVTCGEVRTSKRNRPISGRVTLH
jgi:hypothetical protein